MSSTKEETMPPTYLTEEGFEKLKQELEYLRTIRRQEVAERLRAALEDGDAGIDADAECEAARNEQSFVEGRIHDLEYILANAQIIKESDKKDTIQIGSKVTIQEEGFEPETYTIVGPVESDPTNGRISNESPLGKALLDHKVDDEVMVKSPNGSFTVTISKIE